MHFDLIKAFLTRKMRMSHVYQPVMLRRLLVNGGAANRREIARDILGHDPSQIEYYETIVQKMVGRVLTAKNGMVTRERDTYRLSGVETLNDDQLNELVGICDELVTAYSKRRGSRIWDHRRRQGKLVSGSSRYEVLKRARYRCELCGISADEKALEVDHIQPRNRGGSDDLINLQALCFSCNASKRDRDDTDFRGYAAMYAHREHGCIFCSAEPSNVTDENELAFTRRDGFPVTNLHTLIIPKRHVRDYFDLTQPELNAIRQLITRARSNILTADAGVHGFNIGINAGQTAGQTIMHCHVHLIPRRDGDVEVPRGGVRNIIPGKGNY